MYRYETHCHTSETSKCGITGAADFVRFFKNKGYDGVFITDHFFRANIVDIPENYSWEQKVDVLLRGYEVAREEGAKVGLDVFLGWEFGYESLHLLTYGLDREWLLDNPDLISLDYIHYCDRVHESGGFIVNAHPFRQVKGVVRLMPYNSDAAEIINGANADNKRSAAYAEMMGLPVTAGSDIHNKNTKANLAGVLSETKFGSVYDYIDAVKNRKVTLFEFSNTADRIQNERIVTP